MAFSKHSHLRYNILDYCFRFKAFNIDELLNFVNDKLMNTYDLEPITTRTLQADLKTFRDKDGFDAPLPRNIRILRYSDANFSIAQRKLLKNEQYLIDATYQLLERFENDPKYNKLSEALIKFEDEDGHEEINSSVLYYDHNEEYKGINYLKPLYFAIKKKQVLEVTYKGFKDTQSKTFEFHPQVLKQYNRRWFVFGYNKTQEIKTWSIPLDERLLDFKVLEDVAYQEYDMDWSSYFREMVGIVRPFNAELKRVVLQFYNGREAYFKTKPFIPDFEEFFEEDKQDQVWFDTIINYELIQQLLSYGKDVEVLEPKELVDKMKEHYLGLQQLYEK
ncbi:MAG: WYL domain-containing protein [Flavobacteriales bacterium]|nr:MAG: WYL domain-containing protein [Flavobacteriales bacterium]